MGRLTSASGVCCSNNHFHKYLIHNGLPFHSSAVQGHEMADSHLNWRLVDIILEISIAIQSLAFCHFFAGCHYIVFHAM